MYTLHITLTPEAKEAALTALIQRGLPVRENFDGPIFEDCSIDWECAPEAGIGVQVIGGAYYFYPWGTIARLKIPRSD